MLSNVINHASNQVEGFCFIKSLQLKVNVKGAEYLDIMLADADGEINAKLWDYANAPSTECIPPERSSRFAEQ